MARRMALGLSGAAAGAALWALVEAEVQGLLGPRALIVAATLAAGVFGTLLLAGARIGLARAVLPALGLGAGTAGLLLWASFRHEVPTGLFDTGVAPAALAVLLTLPLPFVIAAAGPGWRDDSAVAAEAGDLAVRALLGLVFTALVWLVVFLSDALLGLVGIDLVEDLLEVGPVPYVVTGGAFGLALGVAAELGARAERPGLGTRLLRVLVPVVLPVTALFLAVVPVVGLDAVFRDRSAAMTLLAMALAGAALVTAAAGTRPAEAAAGLPAQAARGLALMVPLLAALAVWAIWLRVAQHGLTPGRLIAALGAALALAHGLGLAALALRGAAWSDGVRRVNRLAALAAIVLAALLLTPALDAEALSARSQLARVAAGRIAPAAIDLAALDRWGTAGRAARAELTARARASGDAALAAALARPGAEGPRAVLRADRLARLAATLPVQPPRAAAFRDRVLAALSDDELAAWDEACARPQPDARLRGCVLAVADLRPGSPGDEGIALLDRGGWVQMEGLAFADGDLQRLGVLDADPAAGRSDPAALLAAWQGAAPRPAPVPAQRLGPGPGLMLAP
jgi:hypothetical protein